MRAAAQDCCFRRMRLHIAAYNRESAYIGGIPDQLSNIYEKNHAEKGLLHCSATTLKKYSLSSSKGPMLDSYAYAPVDAFFTI